VPSLKLTDDDYAAVQAAAAPIHPLQRGLFPQALAKELERHPVVGAGLVHRLAVKLQRRYIVSAHLETPVAPRHRPRHTLHANGVASRPNSPPPPKAAQGSWRPRPNRPSTKLSIADGPAHPYRAAGAMSRGEGDRAHEADI
jgi:hypothetical protein